MKIRLTAKAPARLAKVAYTLCEAVVAVALMAILFLALYAGMSSGFAITQVSRENLRATQILVERAEGIRLFNWNQLMYSNWLPAHFTNWYYPLTNAGESPGTMYVGEMRVIPNPTLNPPVPYSAQMAAVTTTVSWVSGGIPRTRTLTTYVARNGIQNYVYNSTNYISVAQ